MSDELRQSALKLLARREHSRAELTAKLAGKGEPAQIAATLDSLAADGYLSDQRFAESYVAAHAARCGAVRLSHELRTRGVPKVLIDQALASLETDELSRARELWRRKFGTPPADARDWARQSRFLHGRGFSSEIVRQLLRMPRA